MNIEKMQVSTLSTDPANARKHSERNIDAIKSSLRRFGQQKPIVVDASNVVRAGNGTLEAARQLGWEEIDACITPLQGSEATAYAVADNRTSELAEWEDGVLAATLEGLKDDDTDLLASTGFTDGELADLLSATEDEAEGGGIDQIESEYQVLVDCTTEEDQIAILEQLQSEGRRCRALIS